MQCNSASVCVDPCEGEGRKEVCLDVSSECSVRNHEITCVCRYPNKHFVDEGQFCKKGNNTIRRPEQDHVLNSDVFLLQADVTPKFDILVHKSGSLLTTEDLMDITLKHERKVFYSLQQEILDRTLTSEYSNCDPELNQNEDHVLERCLLEKFDLINHCRFADLDGLVEKHGLTAEYADKRSCDTERSTRLRDSFVASLKDVIDGFKTESVSGNYSARCGHRLPCVSRIFRHRRVEKFTEVRPEKIIFLVSCTVSPRNVFRIKLESNHFLSCSLRTC